MKFREYLKEQTLPVEPTGKIDLESYKQLWISLDRKAIIWINERPWLSTTFTSTTQKTIDTLNRDDLKDKIPNPLYIGFKTYPDNKELIQRKAYIKRANQIANGIGYKFDSLLQKVIKGYDFTNDYWVKFRKISLRIFFFQPFNPCKLLFN